MLFRLRRPLAAYPSSLPSDFDDDALVPITDAAPLHDAMRASTRFEAGSVRFDGSRLTWRTPDGGQLEANLVATCLSIRPHCHWDHVAQLFDVALGVWPDASLFDGQAIQLHDAASLRAFIERSYREKSAWERWRAKEKSAGDAGA